MAGKRSTHFKISVIDLILAADNAVVIGLAAKDSDHLGDLLSWMRHKAGFCLAEQMRKAPA